MPSSYSLPLLLLPCSHHISRLEIFSLKAYFIVFFFHTSSAFFHDKSVHSFFWLTFYSSHLRSNMWTFSFFIYSVPLKSQHFSVFLATRGLLWCKSGMPLFRLFSIRLKEIFPAFFLLSNTFSLCTHLILYWSRRCTFFTVNEYFSFRNHVSYKQSSHFNN